MTQNQINFARLKEDIRHNVETERLGIASLGETSRHNLNSESANWYANATQRSLAGVQSRLADYQRAVSESQVSLNEARTRYQNVESDWYPIQIASKASTSGAIAGGIYSLWNSGTVSQLASGVVDAFNKYKAGVDDKLAGGNAYGIYSFGQK